MAPAKVVEEGLTAPTITAKSAVPGGDGPLVAGWEYGGPVVGLQWTVDVLGLMVVQAAGLVRVYSMRASNDSEVGGVAECVDRGAFGLGWAGYATAVDYSCNPCGAMG